MDPNSADNGNYVLMPEGSAPEKPASKSVAAAPVASAPVAVKPSSAVSNELQTIAAAPVVSAGSASQSKTSTPKAPQSMPAVVPAPISIPSSAVPRPATMATVFPAPQPSVSATFNVSPSLQMDYSSHERLDADYLNDVDIASQGGSSNSADSGSLYRRARTSEDDHGNSALRPLVPQTVRHEWEFPGWGQVSKYDYSTFMDRDADEAPALAAAREEHKLSEWPATAICGNDITSSCFYCTGLVAAQAGVWAPLCMLLVSTTLYLFRSIYGEAVTALPLNGGAYNVLLNTTSKVMASVAACLTILSYTATGVVSAASAAAYLNNIWTDEPIKWVVIGLLAIFAILSLFGISESASSALVIFTAHMLTLTVLTVAGVVHVVENGIDPAINLFNSPSQPAISKALFYGFASAMLGVTGFETSANFVEEQKEGVFVKTLRNMWAICAFFNPALSLLCVFVVDPKVMAANPSDSLAQLGKASAGRWLQVAVAADAFVVLAGAVLTSYVGFTGLLRRLALDRCVPGFLLTTNEWRGTNHWIILGFFGLCVSLYLILDGDVDTLANVYTVSFLGVMGLFAIGNMLLKYKRADLPRNIRASWPTVFAGFLLVAYAFAGTVVNNPSILGVWLLYFTGTGILVGTMFFRVQVLKFTHYFCRSCRRNLCNERNDEDSVVLKEIASMVQDIRKQPIIFFAKRPIASLINKAILYVRQNEDCSTIHIVHCHVSDKDLDEFQRIVSFLDEMYPKIKIDLVCAKGVFGPSTVARLSHELNVPHNLMFMSCPRVGFSHELGDLGGIRLITTI